MIDSLLDRATSVLERRFLTNAFLPVLLLLPAAALPSLMTEHRLDRMLAMINNSSTGTKILIAGGYFTFAWFVAAIVASQWRNIIRLFEGYPLARWPVLDALGKRWHEDRSSRLDADDRWFDSYVAYPAANEVMPTRLGNVLRAAERYPLDRYGADLILVWPRLLQVIPRESAQDVEEARGTLEFVLVLALWFASFAVLAPAVTLLAHGSNLVALICFVGGVGGSYAAYLSGIAAAAEYGEYLRAMFDTYRFALLGQLNLPLPATPVQEHRSWQEFGDFVGRGHPARWQYDVGVAESPHSRPGIESRGASE